LYGIIVFRGILYHPLCPKHPPQSPFKGGLWLYFP
jgi:hypothetical protein